MRLLLLILIMLTMLPAAQADADWPTVSIPNLPDPQGFAGGYAGQSHGNLLFAGGANFPEAPPWEGGNKVWSDQIFVLDSPQGTWKIAGKLPKPLGYGASVQLEDGPLLIGGSNAQGHHRECFQISYRDQKIQLVPFPDLPEALANGAAARVGNDVYLAGGSLTPDATSASRALYRLQLGDLKSGWQRLPDLPAAGRILPVAASDDQAFYLFSGASLSADEQGQVQRHYLKEVWKFTTTQGWTQLADLPHAVLGAPSPALKIGEQIILFGGDDGSQIGFEPRSEHPGFSKTTIVFNPLTQANFLQTNKAPGSHAVTAPTAKWHDLQLILSGEIRPAVRSPEITALDFAHWDAAAANSRSFGARNWIVLVLYLLGMIAIGWWFMHKDASASTEAYFRGSQKIPAWVAGLSIFATSLSSLTFMGIPARAYQTDSSWYLGQLAILAVVPIVAFCYLPFFRRLNLTSAYEFLEHRFNLPCRLFGSFSFILFHIGRIAIVLYLPAVALASVSSIPVDEAILIIGILCVIYTVMGGIEAVVWTDAIQAIVLMGGAILCFFFAVRGLDGGFNELAQVAQSDHKLLQNLEWNRFSIAEGTQSALILLLAFFFNSLVPYTSGQDIVQRYLTTTDVQSARKSLWLTMWLSVFGTLVFFGLGVALFAYFKANPQDLELGFTRIDAILPYFILHQLPSGVSGLIIAAIFAASQSTISSSLNSIATCWIKDVDQRLISPNRADRKSLRIAQIVVIVVGILGIGAALAMAHAEIESAFKLFNTFIGLSAGSLGGLFALGVFTKRVSGSAAFLAAITAFLGVFALHLSHAPVSGLLYAAIGFALCFLLGLIFSFLRPQTATP